MVKCDQMERTAVVIAAEPVFPGSQNFRQSGRTIKIMHHISDVATDPKSITRAGRGGDTFVRGTRYEPPRESRRPVGVSHAASADPVSC
jgi:hypothetical protein